MSRSEGATAHVVPLLEAYAASALAPEEAERIALHLQDCPACRDELEQVRLYQIIRAAPSPAVGPELRQRVYARIAAASDPHVASDGRGANAALATRRKRRAFFAWSARRAGQRMAPGWLSGAVAVALVALLVSVFWALPRLRQSAGNGGRLVGQTPTEAAPASVGVSTAACPASATSVSLPKDAYIADMALTAPTEGWAVGGIMNLQSYSSQGFVLRFHQCHWAPVALDLSNVGLTNLSMDSPTDGWAIGNHSDTNAPFLLHYSNGAWSEEALPSDLVVAQSFFAQVRASAGEVWITAFTHKTSQGQMSPMLLLHLVNGRWASVTSPLPILYTVAPVGPDDLWIVGSTSTVADSADTYRFAHYQHGQWTVMKQPVGAELTTLHAVSATDIWASGYIPNARSNDPTAALPVVAHYDGAGWQVAPQSIPSGAGGVFSYALADGEGWAERTSSFSPIDPQAGPSTSAVSHVWSETDGQWRALNWPYKDINAIYGWAKASSDEFWALGTHNVETRTPDGSGGYTGSGSTQSVLLHYADGAWTRYDASYG